MAGFFLLFQSKPEQSQRRRCIPLHPQQCHVGTEGSEKTLCPEEASASTAAQMSHESIWDRRGSSIRHFCRITWWCWTGDRSWQHSLETQSALCMEQLQEKKHLMQGDGGEHYCHLPEVAALSQWSTPCYSWVLVLSSFVYLFSFYYYWKVLPDKENTASLRFPYE